jgi:hypothetical protein
VREALPTETIVNETTAAKALARAEAARIFGRQAAVFVFDFRGQPVPELAAEVRRVRKAHPDAELLVVTNGQENQEFETFLKTVGSPVGLSFLYQSSLNSWRRGVNTAV